MERSDIPMKSGSKKAKVKGWPTGKDGGWNPPDTYETPNMTNWKYFRKLMGKD